MPFIPQTRLGQTFHNPALRRGYRTPASDQITNKALDAKHKRERRLRQERRLIKIKVNVNLRRDNNRRKQVADENIEKPDNNNIGLNINIQA